MPYSGMVCQLVTVIILVPVSGIMRLRMGFFDGLRKSYVVCIASG